MATIGPVRYPTDTTWECEVSGLAPGEELELRVRSSTGEEITVSVQALRDELASLPTEESRQVMAQLVRLSGSIAGQTSLSGVPTVAPAGGGSSASGASMMEQARAGDACEAEVQREDLLWQSSVEWTKRHPVLTFVLKNGAGGAIAGVGAELVKPVLAKLMALIAAGQLSAVQPTASPGDGPAQRSAVMLREPAPKQSSPPSGDVCLPTDEPKTE